MSEQTLLKEGWGRASKCCGIPVYPAKYKFKMDDPVEFSEEENKARKERLTNFLKKQGLK